MYAVCLSSEIQPNANLLVRSSPFLKDLKMVCHAFFQPDGFSNHFCAKKDRADAGHSLQFEWFIDLQVGSIGLLDPKLARSVRMLREIRDCWC